MGMFREAVAWMGGFIGIQPGLFLGLTIFAYTSSPAISGISQSPALGSSCNEDVLPQTISIWMAYLFMCMVCSASTLLIVRVIVETDANSRALRTCRHANENEEEKEPRHGIGCIAGRKRKVVRPCFCLSIALSFGSFVCNIVAIYLSLKLLAGCATGSPDIIPFAVVGVIAIPIHGVFGWVAITKD